MSVSKVAIVGAVMSLALSGTSLSAAPTPVFACSFGENRVSVTSLGGKLVYRYGSRNTDNLTIVEDSQKRNAFHLHEMWARSELQGIRLVNGAYSYVVFAFFQAGQDSTDESGLAVFKGTKLLSQRMCKTGDDMPDEDALKGLPDDPLGRKIIDSLKL